MAVEVTMPKLSDTMDEGKVLRWLKAVGDRVRPGEILAEVETDKAEMELEAYGEGARGARRVACSDPTSARAGRTSARTRAATGRTATSCAGGAGRARRAAV